MKKIFPFLLTILLFAMGGCQTSPTPTSIISPTITPIITPTPVEKLVFEKEFKDPAEPWCEGGSYDFGDFYCQDGEYHLVAKGEGNIATMNDGDFKNFILQAQMHSIENVGGYGVVFRGQNNSPATFYIFQISPHNGQYQLIKWSQREDQNGVLIPWTDSDAIKKSLETNELKVLGQGSQITLYINGEQLATITDDSFTHGTVGPVVTGQGHAALIYLKVWELP